MIEFIFTPSDVARVRFAFSPLGELAHSVRVLADPSRHALHVPWVRAVRPRLRGLDLEAAGRVASLAATYVVEQVGTVEHSYMPAEFSRRYEEAFGTPLPDKFWRPIS